MNLFAAEMVAREPRLSAAGVWFVLVSFAAVPCLFLFVGWLARRGRKDAVLEGSIVAAGGLGHTRKKPPEV